MIARIKMVIENLKIFAFFLLVVCVGAGAGETKPDFFVAPNGNDTWTGTLEKSDGKGAGPFTTVARAQRAVRELKASLEKTPRRIEVRILPGEYFLKETLAFETQDSGTEAMPIFYSGERTVLSGGVKLTGFTLDEKKRWQLKIPEVERGEWTFSELFVNGFRRFRPRLPKESFYFITSQLPLDAKGFDRFTFAEGEIDKNWRNLNDVEILPFHNWTMSRLRINEVDDARHALTLSSKTPNRPDYQNLARGRRYLVENVFEALEKEGQWYLDNKSGVLTYQPMPVHEIIVSRKGDEDEHPELRGDLFNQSSVIAPRLERLIDIKNASHIHFSGLTFKHCRVKFGPQGYASPQAEVPIPGAIFAVGAQHCSFEHCTVSQVGGYAIELAAGCKDNLIDDCDLTDLGAGGVKLGDTRYRDAAHAGDIAERNTVRNCFIAYGGGHFPAAIGIWVGQSPNNTLEHNEIFDFYYSAFSVGWTWGYGNSNAHHNTIAYNHVHKIGQGVLTDMGAIYTLGVSPGTVIHHNLFHDIESHDYGGWGIYYDEGSTGIVSEDNIVYNCKSAGFHQHYGKENVVRNNIFAYGTENQLMRTRPEEHLTVTFERNIIFYNDANLLGSNWTGGKFALDNNLYWNAGHKGVRFAGNTTLEQWRAKGYDQHSIIEDPQFADPEKFDFHLKENSPVLKIGFKPIDLTGVGPARARVRNENWPRAFPPRPDNEKLPPLPIADDFEDTPVGSKPTLARVTEENATATIRVTDETAASGKHSLKFTDEPKQKAAFNPHMFYKPEFADCVLDGGFSLRMEPGAMLMYEWRDDGKPYKIGPSLKIDGEGNLTANGKTLLKIPHGKWVTLELAVGIGTAATGKYELSVTLPGAEKQTFNELPCGAGFKALNWLGFSSLADAATVFYVDDIVLKPRK